MFIPLKDLNPRRTYPVVNTLLILTNVIVFLYQVTLPPHQYQSFVMANATIPSHIRLALGGHGNLEAAFLPILTSMFLHSGFMHIAGNMLFLWIFGDNVEDYFGHFPYLLFYLACGIGSGLAHIIFNSHSSSARARSQRSYLRRHGGLHHSLSASSSSDPRIRILHPHTGLHHLGILVPASIPGGSEFRRSRRNGRRRMVGAHRRILNGNGDYWIESGRSKAKRELLVAENDVGKHLKSYFKYCYCAFPAKFASQSPTSTVCLIPPRSGVTKFSRNAAFTASRNT